MSSELNGASSLIGSQEGFTTIELQWDKKITREELESFKKCPSAPQGLFQLHRCIESQYRPLPWPSELNQIAIMTEVNGGRGDISAAAKAIQVMQTMNPDLLFDWILTTSQYDAASFLKNSDISKIKIRTSAPYPEKPTKADFLVNGPVQPGWGLEYIQRKFSIDLQGPRFNFLENASHPKTRCFVYAAYKQVKDDAHPENLNQLYSKVHEIFFGDPAGWNTGLIMGLQKGSGIFLDESRITAPLSREYCCPSYLLKLEAQQLRQDILAALNVAGETTLPNYDEHSFNSGYAHRPSSWAKFIDFVAIHEKEKNVTIVLNQYGEFDKLSTQNFSEQIFTPERLSFLEKMGYSSVSVKGSEEDPITVQQSLDSHGRSLTVILRPSFRPNDMKCLQLASERLLATGDNTAAEAWAARCKLYVYENVANGGCKGEFLKQQVDLANTISPDLGALLSVFGNNSSPSGEERDQIINILQNPSLAEHTLRFCNLIVQNYSFKNALEGALKRTAWHHCIPELMDIEAETMDEEFKSGLIRFLKDPDAPPQVIEVKNLPLLAEKIQCKVQQYMS